MTNSPEKFYCPLYGGKINHYDCDELSCAINNGHIFNDGLPPLMKLTDIIKNKDKCLTCPVRNKSL